MRTSSAEDRHEGSRAALVVVVLAVLLVGVVLVWVFWPRRTVVLVGDSILRQTGPDLAEDLRPDHVENTAVNGSGLIIPNVYDWQARVPELLAQDPDEVVVLFVGNHTDVDVPLDPDGDPIEKGSPEFFAAWGEASEALAQELLAAEVEVCWVLPPPMLAPENQAVEDGLRQEYLAVAERHPEIVVVDSHEVLAGEDGGFLAEGEDPQGQVVPLRAGDGVHLDAEGARRLAELIADTC